MLCNVTGLAWKVSQYPTLIGCGAAAVHMYTYSTQILKGGESFPPLALCRKTLVIHVADVIIT